MYVWTKSILLAVVMACMIVAAFLAISGSDATAQGRQIMVNLEKILEMGLGKRGQRIKKSVDKTLDGVNRMSDTCNDWLIFLRVAGNAVAQNKPETLLGGVMRAFPLNQIQAKTLSDTTWKILNEDPDASRKGLVAARNKLRESCNPTKRNAEWLAGEWRITAGVSKGSVCDFDYIGESIIFAVFTELNEELEKDYGFVVLSEEGDSDCIDGKFDGSKFEGISHVRFPIEIRDNGKKGCKKMWRQKADITLTISSDGNILEGHMITPGVKVLAKECQLLKNYKRVEASFERVGK